MNFTFAKYDEIQSNKVFFVTGPTDLCSQIGEANIKVIFKNLLNSSVELYEIKDTGAERVPKDFDKEDYLTLVTPQSKKYLFRRRNEEQSLSLCVSGKTDYLFKGSHFGITCQKPVVVQIFEESKSLHFQSLLVSNRFFTLVMWQSKVI